MHVGDVIRDLGSPILIYPKLARAIGRNACILVCQFLYWEGKGSSEDGYIYKTAEEIEEETTLTYKEQLTVKKYLVDLGILEVYEKRLLHRMYYKINQGKLSEAYLQQHSRVAPKEDRESLSENIGTVSERNPLYTENTSKNTTEITSYNVSVVEKIETPELPKEEEKPVHPSVKEAMKHISPSPTLMREREARALSEINVDEKPFEQAPEQATEMIPMLVLLIAASHEIGCEIRWHGIQDQIQEAVALWGEKVIEKEFREYGKFIATLNNKVVIWHKFKANRLDKVPTLQQVQKAKSSIRPGNYQDNGPQKASMPKVLTDAWQYMREMENGEQPINVNTLSILRNKFFEYHESGMKNIIRKFLESHGVATVQPEKAQTFDEVVPDVQQQIASVPF